MTIKKESKQDRASRMAWSDDDIDIVKRESKKDETIEDRRQRIAEAAKRLED